MFNEYVKTLCPVCDQNILLKTFRLHMEVDEIHKEFATLIEEQVYTTLLHSTKLKTTSTMYTLTGIITFKPNTLYLTSTETIIRM